MELRMGANTMRIADDGNVGITVTVSDEITVTVSDEKAGKTLGDAWIVQPPSLFRAGGDVVIVTANLDGTYCLSHRTNRKLRKSALRTAMAQIAAGQDMLDQRLVSIVRK